MANNNIHHPHYIFESNTTANNNNTNNNNYVACNEVTSTYYVSNTDSIHLPFAQQQQQQSTCSSISVMFNDEESQPQQSSTSSTIFPNDDVDPETDNNVVSFSDSNNAMNCLHPQSTTVINNDDNDLCVETRSSNEFVDPKYDNSSKGKREVDFKI